MQNRFLEIYQNFINVLDAKFDRFVELSPSIVGAILVFLVGWGLAELAARFITGTAHKLRLDFISEKIGLKHFLKRTKTKLTTSQLIAKGAKGYLIFLFFIEATKIAKLTPVAKFLTQVISYVPEVIISLFIMLIGIRVGTTMQIIISTSLSFTKSNTANVLSLAAKYVIITFAVLAALSQLHIAPILIQILFIGFVSMLALAGGLAFGLGGKDVVKELLESIKKKKKKKK